MLVFNKIGNQQYISMIKEMLKSPNFVENFDKKFSEKFKKILSDKNNLIELEGSKDLRVKHLRTDLNLENIFCTLQNCSFSKINKNGRIWNYITCFI